MSSSPENTAPIRRPRQSQAPSQRNQQIYLDYQTGQRQTDLAQKYNLTQCRISQIIRRVEKWLHSAWDQVGATAGLSSSAAGSDTADPAARHRLQHRIQYDRLNEAGRLALQHFHQQQKIVTHKKGARAGKEFHETTKRLLPPSLQCLKVVAQTTAQLTRLENRTPVGWAVPTTAPPDAVDGTSPLTTPRQPALSREQVEAWLTDHHIQAAKDGKIDVDITGALFISDLVSTLLGEPNDGLGLELLARWTGKKVVKRQPYEEKSPPIPPRDGWYYGMHDANGGLVAWLHADQLKHAISPDYPPVSRNAPNPCTPTRSASEGATDAPATSVTPTSSTSPSIAESPQPTAAPALTADSPQTQFPAQYEPEPFDLQSIQPSFYQKGCHN